MANITSSNFADEIYEFYENAEVPTFVEFNFEYQLEPLEIFTEVSLSISKNIENYGSVINGLNVECRINNYFSDTAIFVIRDRNTLNISNKAYSELPDPKTCDVIELIPPNLLEEQIIYTIELKYKDELGVDQILKKDFTQTLYGSYSSIAETMIDYINRGN